MTWQWEPLQFSQSIDKNSFLVWKNSFVLQSRECKGPPQWLGSKGSTCHAGAAGGTGLPSGSGQVSRRRAGSPVQYPCLQNPMDRGAWRATVLRVTRGWTRQTWLSTYAPEKANCFHLACLHDYTDPELPNEENTSSMVTEKQSFMLLVLELSLDINIFMHPPVKFYAWI